MAFFCLLSAATCRTANEVNFIPKFHISFAQIPNLQSWAILIFDGLFTEPSVLDFSLCGFSRFYRFSETRNLDSHCYVYQIKGFYSISPFGFTSRTDWIWQMEIWTSLYCGRILGPRRTHWYSMCRSSMAAVLDSTSL